MNSTRFFITVASVASFTLAPVAQAGRFSFRLPKELPVRAPHSAPHIEVPPARPHITEPPVPKPHPEESFLSEAAKDAADAAINLAIEQVKNSETREDKRFYVEEAFRQLERWHRDITARRAALDLNNQQAIQAFNQEAARYHAALASARRALASIPARV
jgi:hypothetical protein